MIKRKINVCLAFFLFLPVFALSQNDADTTDTNARSEKIKKGWNIGFLPILGYTTDIGLQYGALANLYYYGDGSWYPKYFHSFYFEVSRTSKGGGINQFFYDSEKLIPKMRVTADITYLTEKALDFYGFNGYDATYHPEWEDDEQDTSVYKTRMFYRHERKLLRIGLDLQGKIFFRDMKWLAGFTFLQSKPGSVDIDRLNKGLKESEKLPEVPGLYDEYVSWGIIGPEEKDGGINNLVKLGVIYDTRDNEPNPMKGIWSEVIFAVAPAFLSDGSYRFVKIAVTHRQYFTLIKDDLSFAYRLAYQGTISGKVPFYLQPYMINSFAQTTTIDGLGGSRNLRGILRNRVVGDGMVYGNTEFRWKFWYFRMIKQNFYLALNAFADAGMVVQKIQIDKNSLATGVDPSEYFSDNAETLHVSLGGGLRIAMNQNFIISADFGSAIDNRDGNYGIYIGFGYLF
jgi:hypothetical protein